MEAKVGNFFLSHSLIRKSPEAAQEVFAKTIIIRAESLFHADLIEYTAYSNCFDELEEGEEIPNYDVEFGKDGVSFERVD